MGQTDHAKVDNDTTWDTFPAAQTGWVRMLYVAGADHQDFSDIAFGENSTERTQPLIRSAW